MYTTKQAYEHIAKNNEDPIVQRRTCKVSGTQFPIFQRDIELLQKIGLATGGITQATKQNDIGYLLPTLCPEERQRLRLLFRNEKNLYKRKCDATGKDILSVYEQNSPYKVYDKSYRRSDKRSALDFGQTFDFSKTFTENMDTLIKNVPIYNIQHNKPCENSDYCNIVAEVRNGYMSSSGAYSQDIYYSNWFGGCDSCFDCSCILDCRECYQVVQSQKCYSSSYLYNCMNCTYSIGLTNCQNCSYCIDCDNIVGKKYRIKNKQCTKEDYELALKNINKQDRQKTEHMPASVQSQSENSLGNFLYNCKDIHMGFDCSETKNGRYVYDGWDSTDVLDCVEFLENCESIYQAEEVGDTKNSMFVKSCFGVDHLLYSMNCYQQTAHCFGCVGLRGVKYAIFNKEYTQQEYIALQQKIIGHMKETGERGQYFDPRLSYFGYNETLAQDYFPIKQEDNTRFKRQTNENTIRIPENSNTIQTSEMQTNIQAIDQNYYKNIFIEEETNKPYRILEQEVAFYKKNNISLPKQHPRTRHNNRMQQKPHRSLQTTHCAVSGNEVVTAFGDIKNIYTPEIYTQKVFG